MVGARHCRALLSCHAFKLGMGSEQDARITARISPLLKLRFKCRKAYYRSTSWHFLGWTGAILSQQGRSNYCLLPLPTTRFPTSAPKPN